MARDFEKDYDRLIGRIDADNYILQENKDAIHGYVARSKAQRLNIKTIIKHLYGLEKFLAAMDKHVVLKNATREDVEKAIAKLNGLDLSNEVRRSINVTIKSFYKQSFGDGEFYPKSVRWLKTSIKRTEKILPEDILSEEDIQKMIGAANNLRDKAIIALLFDAGIRVGELLTIRKKDVELGSGQSNHIVVNGKTGMRRIPIFFSVPFLAQYLNLVNDLKPSQSLWWNLKQSNIKGQLDYGGLRKMLKEVADAAGIEKRIYPHLFRHSRASNYANKLTEQQLKAVFGWTGASSMAATYVHLSGRDIDNATLVANGLKPHDSEREVKLKVRECPTCKMVNGIDAIYCTRCGSALDIKTAMDKEKNVKSMKELMIEALKDPKVLDEVSRALLLDANK
ncbi:tyrosine-type recombinase/integrase [Candidatus Marsarchaeota archaeon]|nr:tyrosine-type recombinase/integrase [Candidatus Marsarchaeota archaeon]